MKYYLQISLFMIAFFAEKNGWIMSPIQTKSGIYIVEEKWIDSLQLTQLKYNNLDFTIDRELDSNSVKVVYLHDSVVIN